MHVGLPAVAMFMAGLCGALGLGIYKTPTMQDNMSLSSTIQDKNTSLPLQQQSREQDLDEWLIEADAESLTSKLKELGIKTVEQLKNLDYEQITELGICLPNKKKFLEAVGAHSGDKHYQKGIDLVRRKLLHEGVPFLEKAAEKDYPPAFLTLCLLYKGKDAEKSFLNGHKASLQKEWFVKEGQKEDSRGQNFYATYLDHIEKNRSKAMEWYRKAAVQGLAESQNRLGVLLKRKGNHHEAFIWCKKASDQGDLGACYNIGVMYKDGLGVKQDFKKAADFFEKASDKYFW